MLLPIQTPPLSKAPTLRKLQPKSHTRLKLPMVGLLRGQWCLVFGVLHSAVSDGLTVSSEYIRGEMSPHSNLWIGIGTFQEYYQNVLLPEYSPSTIAWIPSLQLFFMMAMVSLSVILVTGHIC